MAAVCTPTSPQVIDLTLSSVKRPLPRSRITGDSPPPKRRLTFDNVSTDTTTPANPGGMIPPPPPVVVVPSSSERTSRAGDAVSPPVRRRLPFGDDDDDDCEYRDPSDGWSCSTSTIASPNSSDGDGRLFDDDDNYVVKELYIRISREM